MSLSKDIFNKKMKMLIDFYPFWGLKYDDKETILNWYNVFSNFEDEVFVEMVNAYINKETYPPTVAGLKKYKPERESKVHYDSVEAEKLSHAMLEDIMRNQKRKEGNGE